MTVEAHILRRYVIDRATERFPHPEWCWLDLELGVWIRADETTARHHEHYRRIRKVGLEWCDVLGHRTDVRDDLAIQAFFMTIALDEWPQLALAVRRCAKRSLREWRASGARIIAAVDPDTASSGTGPLSGWPKERGTGARSMLPT